MSENKGTDPIIEWAAPPPTQRGRTRPLEPLRAALRGRPGEWALIGRNTALSGSTSKRKFLGPGFEVVSRTIDTKARRGDIYARYVGEVES